MIAAALLFSVAAQVQHDDMERDIYARLSAARETISMVWRPTKAMVKDEKEAERCYVRFHLGKAKSCSAELDRLEKDLKGAPLVTDRQ